MVMRSKSVPRCIRCRMHAPRCICEHIAPVNTDTRLVVVMHFRERAKATATAPLALQALRNSELKVHGLVDAPLASSCFDTANRRLLYLYPSDDATVLSPGFAADGPRVTLVVPDGSWRQAHRMRRRIPGLENAEPVRLPRGEPSRWGLRRETEGERLCTYEAIARAMGILEGASVRQRMEALFDRMMESVIASRGRRRRI